MSYVFFSKVHWMTITQHPHIYEILASNFIFWYIFFQLFYQFPPYQGDVPEIHTGALPTFEDCVRQDHDCGGTRVIEVDCVLVIDGCVARRHKFAGAEE